MRTRNATLGSDTVVKPYATSRTSTGTLLLELTVHMVRAKRDVGGGSPSVPLVGLLLPPLDGYFVICNLLHVVHS